MYAEQLNQVLDEIERGLTDEISYEALAEMLAMSIYEFRRIFAFIIGTPLSEYIRMRKISMAALDLQTTNDSITVIAARYGYESPAAFSRAFRELEGISPTSARQENAVLRAFPRVSLTVTATGNQNIPYRTRRCGAYLLCGYTAVSYETDSGCCEDVWDEFYEKGIHDRLLKSGLYDLLPDAGEFRQFAAYEDFDDHSVRCTIGALLPEGTEIPDGLDVVRIPPALWSIFPICGTTSPQINNAYFHTISDWLSGSAYQRDLSMCNLEAFPLEGGEDTEAMPWEIWYPLKRITES